MIVSARERSLTVRENILSRTVRIDSQPKSILSSPVRLLAVWERTLSRREWIDTSQRSSSLSKREFSPFTLFCSGGAGQPSTVELYYHRRLVL
jgi:hypothetical protein